MTEETSHEQLRRLAEKHRPMLPHDDARQQRLLQILMDHSGPLEELMNNLKAPASPQEIALNAAIGFAMGELVRFTRAVLIETAANSPRT